MKREYADQVDGSGDDRLWAYGLYVLVAVVLYFCVAMMIFADAV